MGHVFFFFFFIIVRPNSQSLISLSALSPPSLFLINLSGEVSFGSLSPWLVETQVSISDLSLYTDLSPLYLSFSLINLFVEVSFAEISRRALLVPACEIPHPILESSRSLSSISDELSSAIGLLSNDFQQTVSPSMFIYLFCLNA